ncbi:zinc finger protein 883-like [Malaya genurostris]|uniref:zinc finger protein 883-like n=1 Tax=Malaya genurostris TaxID=325434 RepID=UPI0026F3865C|nr:zinc finger protein 883-like [Malaya genurostris]
MSCIVPTCDSYGEELMRFPKVSMLSERWLEAIQVGTGLVIESVYDLEHLQICHSHFPKAESSILDDSGYREPSIFKNCDGICIEVSCCRLCLEFYNRDAMIGLDSFVGEKQLKCHIDELFNINFQNDDFFTLVCQQCLVRIEIAMKIKQNSITNELAYHELIRTAQEHSFVVLKEEPNLSPDNIVKEEVYLEDWLDPEQLPGDNHDDDDDDVMEPIETERSPKIRKTRRGRIPKHERGPRKKPPGTVMDNLKRKCYICVKFFPDANALVSHLTETHTTNSVYRCEECSIDIPVLTTYNRHLSRHDETERPNKCSDCPLRFKSTMQLKIHENMIHGANHKIKLSEQKESVIICEICGHKFSHKGKLNDHIQRVHLKIGIPKCDICSKTFTTRSSLERHMISHSDVKPYACDQCDQSYRRLLLLRQHKSLVHEGKNPHVCTECGKEYRGSQALYFHRLKVHLGRQRPKSRHARSEICKLCNDPFPKLSALAEHIKQEHDNEKYPFIQCAECPKTFLSAQKLSQHKPIHTDKYACTKCNIRYSNRTQMQHHMDLKHPDGRKFECHFCGKSYNTTRALSIHIGLHTKEKRFHCEFCQKAFSRNCELIIHRRLHTGEKPFQCIGCLKRFSDDGTFYKHKKICKALKAKTE